MTGTKYRLIGSILTGDVSVQKVEVVRETAEYITIKETSPAGREIVTKVRKRPTEFYESWDQAHEAIIAALLDGINRAAALIKSYTRLLNDTVYNEEPKQ